jgi:hypothetical protein
MQMVSHAKDLKDRGYEGDPAALVDPSKFPLSAVVSLGGCSGSFVSGEGLIITNHHCVTGILQFNSTPEQNLLHDGYVAKNHELERWAGPTQRVYVTTGFRDVTTEVRAAGETAPDAAARAKALTEKQKAVRETCEAGRPEVRCPVVSFFEGEQYYQIEQLEIRDIRLVYAPAEGIGNFGGEIDNWRWPRHTGDYSFIRAYVGPDGKPADYSPQNIPFKSTSHLKVAQGDLDPGDFVMVAGYPGRTSRLKTSDEVYDAMSQALPARQLYLEEYLALAEKLAASDPQLAIKVHSRKRGLNNALTKTRGSIEGLRTGGVARKKAEQEAELRAWIAKDEARYSEYHDVLDQLATLNAEIRATRDRENSHGEIAGASFLLSAANSIYEAALDREKAGKGPLSESKQREQRARVERLVSGFKYFDERIDRANLELALERGARLPDAQRPELFVEIVGEKTTDASARSAAVDKLLRKTKLGDLATLQKMLDTATIKDLNRSQDSIVRLAVSIQKKKEAREAATQLVEGKMNELRPRYVSMLRAFLGDDLAPDANSTLRLTYGSVRGYSPAPGRPVYEPFTVLSQGLAKNTNAFPFETPARLVAAAKSGSFGAYADPELGEVPVDFLSDLDITGGNSGSATLNGKGELVGLAFDGNYEAMASDYMFLPEIQRTIHLDIRYALWLMDAVDGADHLLEEMQLPSTVNGPLPAPQATAVAPSQPATPPAAGAAPAATSAPASTGVAAAPAAATSPAKTN